VVDALLGEFHTVIKPLGKLFRNVDCLSGSSILGNGEVALILDVPSLVQQATARGKRVAGAA
jgi:two-component system, chemotaxis family, sensor kinase CheA